jgi:integrase/recombinase XerD
MHEDLLNEYREYLCQRRVSPKTADEQLNRLRAVLAWSGERPLETVSARELEAIFRCLRREHYPGIAAAARTVNRFFRFLAERGICSENPAQNLEEQNPVRRAYDSTEDELRAILAQPYKHTLTGLRNRALLELSCGFHLKPGDLTEINLADADAEKSQIRLKNGVILQLGEQSAAVLDEYLRLLTRENLAAFSDDYPLFPNRTGERMSYHLCWTIIKNIIAKAGLGRKLLPMDIRVQNSEEGERSGRPIAQRVISNSQAQ